MNAKDILAEIKRLGQESYKKILLNHGAKEPCYGVKVEELKKIQNRIKMDYRLALELYDTGIYDAMYLAGLIADDAQMTKKDLQSWAEKASEPLVGSAVAWVAAGSAHGREMALKWIDSGKELVAAAGWATLSSLVSIKQDSELDLAELKRLLERVQREIHQAPNDVRPKMNGFVIAVGSYVKALTDFAKAIGEKIGPVTVNMGDYGLQGAVRPGLHPEGGKAWSDREKAQVGEMLAANAECGTRNAKWGVKERAPIPHSALPRITPDPVKSCRNPSTRNRGTFPQNRRGSKRYPHKPGSGRGRNSPWPP